MYIEAFVEHGNVIHMGDGRGVERGKKYTNFTKDYDYTILSLALFGNICLYKVFLFLHVILFYQEFPRSIIRFFHFR